MSGTKLALFLGIIVTSAMCLYPPYCCVGTSPLDILPLEEGYYPIFSPPQSHNYNTGRSAYSINYTVDGYRLTGQIIFTSLITMGVSAVLHAIKPRQSRF